jgi:hypothetical protein
MQKLESQPQEKPPLLSILATQKYLGGISRAGLYQMLSDLETVKIGGRRMVLRTSLDALIERSRVAA